MDLKSYLTLGAFVIFFTIWGLIHSITPEPRVNVSQTYPGESSPTYVLPTRENSTLVSQEDAFDGTIDDQIHALDWQSFGGTHIVGEGLAIITTTSEEWFVKGDDAHKLIYLAEGYEALKPDAVILRAEGYKQGTVIIYTFNKIGYVKMDDWEKYVDKDAMLQEIKKRTEAANKIRESGHPSLFIDGWIQEPYLNKEDAVVYWAIAGHNSEGDKVVNAIALKLGRKGFTKVIWLGDPTQFSSAEDSLLPGLEAHKYIDGLTYKNYVPGFDTVAAVGVGALSYNVITGKAVTKTGIRWLTILIAFMKKVWFFIFVPLIFAWKWLRNLFIGKPTPVKDKDSTPMRDKDWRKIGR